MKYWQMSAKYLDIYRNDPKVQRFELQLRACSWQESAVAPSQVSPMKDAQ
jgi:hypothetical protein